MSETASIADYVVSAGFVAAVVVLALAIYALAHATASRRVGEDTRELASSVIQRISALHGLILALVFAQELYQYQEVRTGLVREATAVANIYNDIARYGPERQADVQDALSRYVRIVVESEWRSLARDGQLSPEGWSTRELVYLAVLDLEPSTPRQVALRQHMLADIQKIAELRQSRENAAWDHINPLFWIAAFVGFVLIMVPFFVFRPTGLTLALLSCFAIYTGMILMFIYAFSNPFSSPGELSPLSFERLLQGEIGKHTPAKRT